ncbi:MAG: ABC transporter permease [Syntrophobacteraceae bacterium]
MDSKQRKSKVPAFFGLHARPSRWLQIGLALLPFLLMICVYLVASEYRHSENPADKVIPTFESMAKAIDQVAFTEDKRTGKYLLWTDTSASLKRLGLGIGLASVFAVLFGLNMGLFPGLRCLSMAYVTFISIIPPLAILPILFIVFGVEETGKVALIFIGTFPMITRGVYLATMKIPTEQICKALTLGASQFSIAYRIVLPQIMPCLIDSMRLSLGAAWLFLIASEAIASTDGLGYRIFLVRRYLSMDVIIPYVLWITFLGFVMDRLLQTWISTWYSWYKATKE